LGHLSSASSVISESKLHDAQAVLEEYHSSDMTKPFILPIRRKRGNPNWGMPFHHIPQTATEFELQVRKMGLTTQTYTASARLRTWCEDNKDRCYIPEWLLAEWGIKPEFKVSV